jgi:hypothetical protein
MNQEEFLIPVYTADTSLRFFSGLRLSSVPGQAVRHPADELFPLSCADVIFLYIVKYPWQNRVITCYIYSYTMSIRKFHRVNASAGQIHEADGKQ